MSYHKIHNLYRDPNWLNLFKKVWVTQKIHGTSAHLFFNKDGLHLFSGGADCLQFSLLFNKEKLFSTYKENYDQQELIIYGEAHGGKLQGMSSTYGKELRFIAFDVKLEGLWRDVPHCKYIADLFELEFVWHSLVDNTIENLNFYRDMPSELAKMF